MNRSKLLALLWLVFALATSLWSQTGTSRITGLVVDPTGAVLAGVKVTATNESTNISRTTVSSPAGTYSFESVVPGAYSIAAEVRGFKKYLSTGNILTIGQPMTLNVALEVGTTAEAVTVVASAEAVQTSSSGNFGNLVDQVAVTDLPIVTTRGRNPLQLVDFQPGVVVGSNAGGGVHVHGARDRAWNYTLDGVDINETSAGGADFTPIRTNPDMLAEFRVVTANPTADIGRTSGGQVAMITRSGSNDFHGSAFFFYQTPGFNANTYVNKVATPLLGRDQFVQKIGGFSLGGPIRKNKTFFFGNFQFLRALHTAKVTRYVLTQPARQGLFRYVVNPANCAPSCPHNSPAGSSGASVDTGGNVMPGVNVGTYNIVGSDPAGRGLDQSIQQFIGLTPLPNNFSVGDGLNIAGFDWIPAERENQNDYLVKIDHTFNDRHSMFVRWASGHQDTNGDTVNDGQPSFPGQPNWVNTQRTPRNLAINWRWTPNERSTNELVLGMNRFIFNFANGDPHFNSNPGYFLNYMVAFDGLASSPLHNDAGNLRALTSFQLTDNFTHARGSHTFRWGGQILYQRHIDDRGSIGIYNANPVIYFDTNTNGVDPTAFGIPADMNTDFDLPNAQGTVNDLLGRVGAIDVGFVSKGNQWQPTGTWFNFDSRFPEYDLYVQDNWKVKSNLVIDAGVRWEIKMSPRNPHNLILRPNQPMIYGATATNNVSWVPGQLYDNQWHNFGPSIGFAWDPFKDGKTSVRGNYRLAFDRLNTFVVSSSIIQSLPGLTYSYENTLFGTNGGRLSDSLPPLAITGVTPTELRTPPPFSTNYATVMDPNITTPKTHMWGLSLQRELPHKMVLELNYLGRHGTNLFGGYDSNAHQIFSNGFLDAFNVLKAGGNSALVNALLANYPGLDVGQTGSQYIQANFASSLSRNSIGSVAKFINQAIDSNGNQLIATNGFSPFFFTPFPQFADEVDVLDTHDYSNYHAFEAQLQRRFANGMQFQVSYTFAKSLDTRSYDPTFTTIPTGSYQSSSSIPFDNGRRSLNYARSDFDRRHALQGNWVYELPFGSGRQWLRNLNPVVDRIVGGWGLSGIFTVQSGRPFTVYSGAYTFNDTVMTPASCNGCSQDMGRLNWQNGAAYSADAKLYYFTAAQLSMFYQPPAGQLGNIPRNFFSLPMNFNIDASVMKKIAITERQELQFRLEVQNLTNSVIHDIPANSRITSTAFGDMTNGDIFNNQRRMQLSAKYTF